MSDRLYFPVPDECDNMLAQRFLRDKCGLSARIITRLKREKDGILMDGKILRTIDCVQSGKTVPTYTKEDVRAVLASKSAAGYKKEVKELLEKYGAQQLKQVNPDDYAAILKEAEVIGNA